MVFALVGCFLNLTIHMYESTIGNSATVDSSTDRKKQVHLYCEKMRREAIKVGYAELKHLLPSKVTSLGYKLTNANILYRAADCLRELKQNNKDQTEEINRLRSEVVALQIICQNYARLSFQEEENFDRLSDINNANTLKFELFREMFDYLGQSFDSSVNFDSYPSLAQSMLVWFEQTVDFQHLPELFNSVVKGKKAR
ncbi:Max-like protein X [Trichinella murrelli]|uniref:Max-like protein X n=5 Tax=Trichinella TaxID=6333 RepID=A0A0V0TSE4_9BILA|nr:Max-like protein X [Trichinella murrelli]